MRLFSKDVAGIPAKPAERQGSRLCQQGNPSLGDWTSGSDEKEIHMLAKGMKAILAVVMVVLMLGSASLLLVAACGPTAAPAPLPVQPTATPVPPTNTPKPKSCEEVEGNCLEISFDGGSCALEGPTSLSTGPITVFFYNESEDGAAVELLKLKDDKTMQDLIDDVERRPTEGAPDWVMVWGIWKTVQPGEVYSPRGVLRPGIYGVVCGRVNPHRVWFGGGVTVEE
jgi:hypothetical protein